MGQLYVVKFIFEKDLFRLDNKFYFLEINTLPGISGGGAGMGVPWCTDPQDPGL